MVNHTLFEWGKKNNVLHQQQTGVALAVANLLAKERMRAETAALEAQIALRAKYAALLALLGLIESDAHDG